MGDVGNYDPESPNPRTAGYYVWRIPPAPTSDDVYAGVLKVIPGRPDPLLSLFHAVLTK